MACGLLLLLDTTPFKTFLGSLSDVVWDLQYGAKVGTRISMSATELTFDSRSAISLIPMLPRVAATMSVGNPKTVEEPSIAYI